MSNPWKVIARRKTPLKHTGKVRSRSQIKAPRPWVEIHPGTIAHYMKLQALNMAFVATRRRIEPGPGDIDVNALCLCV